MTDTKARKRNRKHNKRLSSVNETDTLPKVKVDEDRLPKNVPTENNSNVRSIKKRLEIECDYISRVSSYVRIPGLASDDLDVLDSDLEEQDAEEGQTKSLFVTSENRAKSHKELQERFQKKLDEIREKRKQDSQDKLKPKLSKAMKKADKKKKDKEALKQNLIKAGKHSGNLNKGKPDNKSFEGVKTKDEKNGEEKIVFSKFDFVEPESGLKALKKKHMDPQAALNKIKKSKEKLQTMKEKGMDEKVSRIEDKMAWQKAIDKAGGAKLKDDVDLLKKSLKKKQQKKKASMKKWEERKENVDKKKDENQKKRQDNIKKRKHDVKEKKKKDAIKKGRLVPGV